MFIYTFYFDLLKPETFQFVEYNYLTNLIYNIGDLEPGQSRGLLEILLAEKVRLQPMYIRYVVPLKNGQMGFLVMEEVKSEEHLKAYYNVCKQLEDHFNLRTDAENMTLVPGDADSLMDVADPDQ